MYEQYLIALEKIRADDPEGLHNLLKSHPGLAAFRPPPDKNGHQNTLLHEATGMGDVQHRPHAAGIAALLVDHGADVDAGERSDGGETPLIHAVSINNVPVAKVLLEKGADPEKNGRYDGTIDTALGYALFYGRDERLKKYPVNCPELLLDAGASVSLPYAAAMADDDLFFRFFDENGKFISGAGKPTDEKLALHQAFFFACKYGSVKKAAFLLTKGVEINASLPFFHFVLTGLHLACQHGNQEEMVDWLLQNGADPSKKDNIHLATPSEWAQALGHDKVLDVFRRYGMD